jgi:hypothetical protein
MPRIDGQVAGCARLTSGGCRTPAKQDSVYQHSAKSAVMSTLEGYNATIIAYGPTGTGKTFTMEGQEATAQVRSWAHTHSPSPAHERVSRLRAVGKRPGLLAEGDAVVCVGVSRASNVHPSLSAPLVPPTHASPRGEAATVQRRRERGRTVAEQVTPPRVRAVGVSLQNRAAHIHVGVQHQHHCEHDTHEQHGPRIGHVCDPRHPPSVHSTGKR